MSDIDTAVVDSLKALDPKRPIREAADPQKGFAKDAKFDMEGFRNVLKLRAEILRTPGTDPSKPEKYLDLSYYQRALAGL